MAIDPFGAPPSDEDDILAVAPLPDADPNDPYGSIGTYDEQLKLVAGSTSKLATIGRVTGVTPEQKPAGLCLAFSITVTEGRFAGRDFTLYCSTSPRARFKQEETYTALSVPADGTVRKSHVVGQYVTVNLEDELYNGKFSAKIKGIARHPKGTNFRGAADVFTTAAA